jgi:hypothetical protein
MSVERVSKVSDVTCVVGRSGLKKVAKKMSKIQLK